MRHIASAALDIWVARDTSSLWNLYLSAISPPHLLRSGCTRITKFVAKRENEDQHTNISLWQFFLLISLKRIFAESRKDTIGAYKPSHRNTLYEGPLKCFLVKLMWAERMSYWKIKCLTPK